MKIKKNIIHKLAKGEKNGSYCHSRAPYKTGNWKQVTCKKCLKKQKEKLIHFIQDANHLNNNAKMEALCGWQTNQKGYWTNELVDTVDCPECLDLLDQKQFDEDIIADSKGSLPKNEEKNVIDYIIDIFKESVGLHNVTPEEIQIAFEKVDDHVILEIAMEIVKYRLDIR